MTEASMKGSGCSQLACDKSSREFISYYFHTTTTQDSNWLAVVFSLPLLKMFDFVHIFVFELLNTKVICASGIIQDYFPVLSL